MKSNGSFSDISLVDELPPALVCSICHNCPFNPKQCRKGHLFCDGCITKWLCVEQTCPLDRAPLCQADLSDNLLARNLISKLRVRCPNHAPSSVRDSDAALEPKRAKLGEEAQDASCAWLGPLEELEAHRKACPCEVVACVHAGCDVRLRRSAWPAHVDACLFAIEECQQCKSRIERCRLEVHLANEVRV